MIIIKKNNVITNVGPDQEWLQHHIEMGSFGKTEYTVEHLISPEHTIQKEVTPVVMSEDGLTLVQKAVFEDVVVPAVIETEVIPAEFTWEEVESLPKSQDEINSEALAYLASTDWYVVRLSETGESIPTDISQARAIARSQVVR